jgi:hypothetical protein
MAIAGYRCAIRRGGIVTSTSSEAFTALGGGVFQITSAARRVIDPTQPWSLMHNSTVTLPFSSITGFDFLFGEVTTTGVVGTLTFNGSFIPMTTSSEIVAEVKSHSLSESTDLLETSVYTGPGGTRTKKRIVGLADASISLDLLLNLTAMDRLTTLYQAGANAILEVNTGSTAIFRGIGKIESLDRSGSVEGLLEVTMEWKLASERDALTRTGLTAAYSERVP